MSIIKKPPLWCILPPRTVFRLTSINATSQILSKLLHIKTLQRELPDLMPDLLTRLKHHPANSNRFGSDQPCLYPGSRGYPELAKEWFHLLIGPPRTSVVLGQPRFFESPLHASDWISSNIQSNNFQQGMALTFSLPFPGSNKHYQLSCIPTDSASEQKYIDFMVKEIQLLGSLLAGVDIPYLHWSGDLISNLSSSELTQLMFHIDRSFKIFRQKDPRLIFELDELPDSTDQIALIAGLGFNTACINEPSKTRNHRSMMELLDCIGLVKSFNIDNIYTRVNARESSQSAVKSIRSLIDHDPAGILISDENALSKDHLVRNVLSEAYYYPVRNNFFVRRSSTENKTVHCLKGIGLGAVSYIKRFQIHNTNTLDDYYSRLSVGQLPIQSVAELHFEI